MNSVERELLAEKAGALLVYPQLESLGEQVDDLPQEQQDSLLTVVGHLADHPLLATGGDRASGKSL